jgi:hypothetical protein
MVHVHPHHPTLLNKHCRFCPDCDLLIVHQDELETMLVQTYQDIKPEIIGNEYLVMGTVDKSTWRRREKESLTIENIPEYLHDFKEYLGIDHTPAGWYPGEDAASVKTPPFPEPTLDDPEQVKELMEAMGAHLPISAEIQRATARHLRSQGVPIPPHRQVSIYHVLYHGDEGGIVCSLSPSDSKEAIIISLTHLKIPYYHPLSKAIRAYQKTRIDKLSARAD